MMASSSVPAILALSGLALAVITFAIYIIIIFLAIIAILFPFVYFARKFYFYITYD